MREHMIDRMFRQARERARKRHEKVDPGPWVEPAVEFGELPAGTPALTRDALVECLECHCLVLRTSTDAHSADHRRWLASLTAGQWHDGELTVPLGWKPIGDTTSGAVP